MDILQLPDDFPASRGSRIALITTDSVTASDPSGTAQTRLYGVPKWGLSLVSPDVMNEARAGAWKALTLMLRGSVNRVAAFDPSRPVPLGSLRGSPTLSAPLAKGDVTALISAGSGQAGKTLAIGDLVGIGTGFGTSQLVCAVQPATADGSGALSLRFEAPARRDYPAGTAIVLIRPRAYFMRLQGRAEWGAYSRTRTSSMSIDLVEDIGS